MPEPTDADFPERTDEDTTETTDEDTTEPTDEDTTEPTDEDLYAGRHRSEPPPDSRGLSRWVAPAALLIAVIALAGTGWALFRPSWLPALPYTSSPATDQHGRNSNTAGSTTSGSFTDQQVADAKGRACAASLLVSQALNVQTHADLGTDPVALHAVAANARLSLIGGGQYLLVHLDPATSAPLTAAVRTYANQLQDIALHAMAGTPNDDPAQSARQRDIEATDAQIADLCK